MGTKKDEETKKGTTYYVVLGGQATTLVRGYIYSIDTTCPGQTNLHNGREVASEVPEIDEVPELD